MMSPGTPTLPSFSLCCIRLGVHDQYSMEELLCPAQAGSQKTCAFCIRSLQLKRFEWNLLLYHKDTQPRGE